MTDISVARRLGLIILLDVLLAAGVAAVLYTNPEFLSSILPGLFGFSTSVAFTGNYFVGALIVLLTGVLILLASFFSLLSRLSHGVLIGPAQLRHWLDDDAAVSRLVEEQTQERRRLQGLHRFFLLGAVLFFAGAALTSFTYAKANPGGTPIFENDAGAVANSSVSRRDAVLFTLDQIAGGVAIGMPDHYGLRAARVTFNTGNRWVMASAMTLRAVSLIIGLVILFVLSRSRALKSYILGAGTILVAENIVEPPVAPVEPMAPEAEPEAENEPVLDAVHHPAEPEESLVAELQHEDVLPPQIHEVEGHEENHVADVLAESEVSHPDEADVPAEVEQAHSGEQDVVAEAVAETHDEHGDDAHAPHGKHAAAE